MAEEEVRRNALAAMLEDGGHFWRQTQSGRAWQIVSQIAIQTSLPLDASLPLTPTTSKCIFNTILLLLFDNEAGILLHFSNFFPFVSLVGILEHLQFWRAKNMSIKFSLRSVACIDSI